MRQLGRVLQRWVRATARLCSAMAGRKNLFDLVFKMKDFGVGSTFTRRVYAKHPGAWVATLAGLRVVALREVMRVHRQCVSHHCSMLNVV